MDKVNGVKPAQVSIKKDGDKIHVGWMFTTLSKEINGKLSCFIPAFNIYFSAKDMDMVEKKSMVLTQMYMDNFVLHQKGGIGSLVRQLHKLGFTAPKDAIVKKSILKDGKIPNAKFSSHLSTSNNGYTSKKELIGNLEMAA